MRWNVSLHKIQHLVDQAAPNPLLMRKNTSTLKEGACTASNGDLHFRTGPENLKPVTDLTLTVRKRKRVDLAAGCRAGCGFSLVDATARVTNPRRREERTSRGRTQLRHTKIREGSGMQINGSASNTRAHQIT